MIATMRSTSARGSAGTSSQKSIAMSASRYCWSDASAQPGTSRSTRAATASRRPRFVRRSSSLAA
jgi:hypothetical protein